MYKDSRRKNYSGILRSVCMKHGIAEYLCKLCGELNYWENGLKNGIIEQSITIFKKHKFCDCRCARIYNAAVKRKEKADAKL